MNPRTLAPLLLGVGIAIGFGAAMLLMDGGEQSRGSSAEPITREETARSSGVGGKELAAPGALPRADSAGEIDSAAASDARAVLTGTAESARVAAASAEGRDGTGSFRGVVRGPSGAPFAGADVLASPVRSRRDAYELGASTSDIGRAWDGHLPIESDYVEPMMRVLEERRQTRSATTDDDGRFVLEGLTAGRHGLTAFAEGFQGERLEANTGAEVELWLVPIAAFEIEPRLPDGSQPERAVIELEADGRRRMYRWSPDEPSLRIPDRAATLRVLAGEVPSSGRRGSVGTFTSEQRTIDLDVDGPGPHVFELASTPIVRVTMIGADGEDPMESAWVRLERDGGEPRSLTRTDETTYIAGDVSPGAYTLVAGEIPDVEALSVPIEVTVGLNEPSLQLPVAEPDDVLVIRCVDELGRAVEQVSFTAELHRAGGRVETRRIGPVEHRRGEWWLPRSTIVDRRGDPVPFDLLATSESMGTERAPVAVDLPSVRLLFEPPCRLVIEVRGSRSQGLYLGLRDSEAGGEPPYSLSASVASSLLMRSVPSSARLTVGAVQPGRYEISLNTSRSPWSTLPIVSRTVVLESGPHVETLALPPLHDLTVRLPEVAIGENVRLGPEGASPIGSVMSARVEDNGLATFREIPAGDYRLNAGSTRWPGGVMPVTVPCGVVEFAPAEVLGLEVRRIRDDAPLAGSGLRAGDVILRSEDRDASDSNFLNDISTALASGPVTVEVQRGSTVTSIVLEIDAADVPQGDYPVTGLDLRRSLR